MDNIREFLFFFFVAIVLVGLLLVLIFTALIVFSVIFYMRAKSEIGGKMWERLREYQKSEEGKEKEMKEMFVGKNTLTTWKFAVRFIGQKVFHTLL